MSDETAGQDDGEEQAAEPAKKKLAGKKLVLGVAVPLFLLIVGGGAAAFFMLSGDEDEEQAQIEEQSRKQAVFFDLPEMLVNLNSGGKTNSYLKVRVALELDSQEAVLTLEALLPRVVDNFQIYLRELRLEDLNGSTGMLRLKEELLRRINAATDAEHVKDILFKEMLVQ